MIYREATAHDAEAVTDIVQKTKAVIYPRYYPKEIVDFFGNLHCFDHVLRDINRKLVYVLEEDGVMVGTGSLDKNHITRVYVLPEFQGRGFGAYIVKELEKIISQEYDCVYLDASLPACAFYEKYGYHTIHHDQHLCENNAVLVYDVMKKFLNNTENRRIYHSANTRKKDNLSDRKARVKRKAGTVVP